MAALTTYSIVPAGTKPTFVAAGAAGDTAAIGSGRNTFLVVKNGHATLTRTVTLASDMVLDSGADYPDKTVTVPALGEVWIPIIRDYASADDPDRCNVTYSDSAADLTVAVVRR